MTERRIKFRVYCQGCRYGTRWGLPLGQRRSSPPPVRQEGPPPRPLSDFTGAMRRAAQRMSGGGVSTSQAPEPEGCDIEIREPTDTCGWFWQCNTHAVFGLPKSREDAEQGADRHRAIAAAAVPAPAPQEGEAGTIKHERRGDKCHTCSHMACRITPWPCSDVEAGAPVWTEQELAEYRGTAAPAPPAVHMALSDEPVEPWGPRLSRGVPVVVPATPSRDVQAEAEPGERGTVDAALRRLGAARFDLIEDAVATVEEEIARLRADLARTEPTPAQIERAAQASYEALVRVGGPTWGSYGEFGKDRHRGAVLAALAALTEEENRGE